MLVPGGRLLLLDHAGSTWPPIYAAQWHLEQLTIRAGSEHFTRRQLALVRATGFQVAKSERLKAGTVERIHALNAATPATSPKRGACGLTRESCCPDQKRQRPGEESGPTTWR